MPRGDISPNRRRRSDFMFPARMIWLPILDFHFFQRVKSKWRVLITQKEYLAPSKPRTLVNKLYEDLQKFPF